MNTGSYINPVLAEINRILPNVDYCIYEEEKYTQSSDVSPARIRHLDKYKSNIHKNAYGKIIFICGISSTLNTLSKVREFFISKMEADKLSLSDEQIKSFEQFSIIQVLNGNNDQPSAQGSFELPDSKMLTWDTRQKKVTLERGEGVPLIVQYLVEVYSEWKAVEDCEWCFPRKDPLLERPLVATGIPSVIPMQMIGHQKKDYARSPLKNVWFFKKNPDESFKCEHLLYYNHLQRGSHHFRYYFRTAEIQNYLFDNARNRKEFSKVCATIRKEKIDTPGSKSEQGHINIIVCPMHFSNERFPIEINREVFNNTAHIISFDPRKEYRSNFEVKYSNYAFTLHQLLSAVSTDKDSILTPCIHFYYVDDEIITGYAFNQARSFVTSLMREYEKELQERLPETQHSFIKGNYEIFSAVITLLDRCSNSTKLNYVKNLSDYYSFLHISIPSIRNYGDSCPLCKEQRDAEMVYANCVLSSTAKYWQEKIQYLSVRSLSEARKQDEKASAERAQIKHRHFLRLYCENLLWEGTLGVWDEQSFLSAFFHVIRQAISKVSTKLSTKVRTEEQFEYLISFIKAISRPFLFYKENEKKAAFKFVLSMLLTLTEGSPDDSSQMMYLPTALLERSAKRCAKYFKETDFYVSNDNIKNERISLDLYQEKIYSLLCVIISCLSDMGSNYILSAEHIRSLCDFVEKIYPDRNCFDDTEAPRPNLQGFFTIMVNAFKGLISGVSGREKSNWVDFHGLAEYLNHKMYGPLFQVLYIENTQYSDALLNERRDIEKIFDHKEDSIARYQRAAEKFESMGEKVKCTFFLHHGQRLYRLVSRTPLAGVYPKDCFFNMTDARSEMNKRGYIQDVQKSYWFVFEPSQPGGGPKSAVFLRMEFSGEFSEQHRLYQIRKLLIHRQTVLDAVQKDLQTGVLLSALQAKVANSILASNKTDSHGQSPDVGKLLDIVCEKFAKARSHTGSDAIQKWREAYRVMNLFMNRCISFGATQKVVADYFPAADIAAKLGPFQNRVQTLTNLHKEIKEQYKSDLNTYLTTITNPDSPYYSDIFSSIEFKTGKKRLCVCEKVKIDLPESDFDRLKNIACSPYFIDKHHESAVYLIAILDILLRNAVEHSGKKVTTISIRCKTGDEALTNLISFPKSSTDDYSSSFQILFKNNQEAEPDDAGIGFTKIFLTEHLSTVSKGDGVNRFFHIDMNKSYDEKWYQATITCVYAVLQGGA